MANEDPIETKHRFINKELYVKIPALAPFGHIDEMQGATVAYLYCTALGFSQTAHALGLNTPQLQKLVDRGGGPPFFTHPTNPKRKLARMVDIARHMEQRLEAAKKEEAA